MSIAKILQITSIVVTFSVVHSTWVEGNSSYIPSDATSHATDWDGLKMYIGR